MLSQSTPCSSMSRSAVATTTGGLSPWMDRSPVTGRRLDAHLTVSRRSFTVSRRDRPGGSDMAAIDVTFEALTSTTGARVLDVDPRHVGDGQIATIREALAEF